MIKVYTNPHLTIARVLEQALRFEKKHRMSKKPWPTLGSKEFTNHITQFLKNT